MKTTELKKIGFCKKSENEYVKNFYDLKEFLEDVERGYMPEFENPNKKWTGGSFKEALARANFGNYEKTNEFFTTVNDIKGDNFVSVENFKRDFEGDYLDVSTFLSGDMECFYTSDKQDVKKSINIYVSEGVVCGLSLTAIRNRGAVICALVDALQSSGFFVNLSLYGGSCAKRNKFHYFININCSPVDLDLLSTVTCDPAFCRQLNINYLLQLNKKYALGISHGLPMVTPHFKDGVIFAGCEGAPFSSVEKSKETLTNIVDKIENNKDLKLVI